MEFRHVLNEKKNIPTVKPTQRKQHKHWTLRPEQDTPLTDYLNKSFIFNNYY